MRRFGSLAVLLAVVPLLAFGPVHRQHAQDGQQLATGVDEMYAKYDDDGLAYVTLLSQDLKNHDTDRQDLIEWSENFGVTTTPIVADHVYTWEILGQQVAFPRVLLLDRDMRVLNDNVGQTHDVIEAAVRDALGL